MKWVRKENKRLRSHAKWCKDTGNRDRLDGESIGALPGILPDEPQYEGDESGAERSECDTDTNLDSGAEETDEEDNQPIGSEWKKPSKVPQLKCKCQWVAEEDEDQDVGSEDSESDTETEIDHLEHPEGKCKAKKAYVQGKWVDAR